MRMRMVKLGLLLAVAMAVLLGCGASLEKKLVGQYNGEVAMPKSSANDPGAKMAEAFGSMLAQNMTLELKDDKTFKMTAMGIPVEGTWTVEGQKVVMKTSSVMGMSPSELKTKSANAPGAANLKVEDIEKPMELAVSEDGKTLTTTDNKNGGALTFKRKE